jgi:sugar lactone lactonase YvrE
MTDYTTLVEGRAFLEGPRWRDGALYVSDMHGHEVIRVAPTGRVEVVAEVPGQPSGIGWWPDGTMVVVSMLDRTLVAVRDGRTEVVADLSTLAPFAINDMVVDGEGRAYIGQFGFDMYAGAPFAAADLLRADPDGSVHRVAPDMRMANGMVLTDDGRTLVVAESIGKCLTSFVVAADGSLGGRRVWAELPEFPDGICIDSAGAVWVASPVGDRFILVTEGGGVVDEIPVSGRHAIACALGGDDGRTLFMLTSTTLGEGGESRARMDARIDSVRVDTPGAR